MPHGDPQAYEAIAAETGVDPEILQLLAERGLLDEEAAMKMAEMARSQEMMDTPLPGASQNVGPMGVTVAPNPLQYAASTLRTGMGAYQQMQQMKQLEALRRRRASSDATVGAAAAKGY